MIEMENPESWIPESMQAHRLLVKSPKTRTFPQRPRFPIVLPIGNVRSEERLKARKHARYHGAMLSSADSVRQQKSVEGKNQRTVTGFRSVGRASPLPFCSEPTWTTHPRVSSAARNRSPPRTTPLPSPISPSLESSRRTTDAARSIPSSRLADRSPWRSMCLGRRGAKRNGLRLSKRSCSICKSRIKGPSAMAVA